MDREDRLTIDGALDRRLVPDGGGRRFLRLTVRAPRGLPPASRKPLNLAFVLDRSGSMAGDKLRLVKEAVAFGLGQLTAEDRAAVVIYDESVETLAPSRPMTGANRARATLALGAVREGGSTALGEGWLTGCRLVAAAGAELDGPWLTRCLLLTDGLANVGLTDPRELVGHATALRRRGVTTTTLGVGADFDEQLLNGLAEAGGGNFYFIEHARQIPDFFRGELGELLTVVAERVTVTLTLPPGARGEVLNDYPCERAGKTFTIEVGNVSAGEEKHILIALRCDPGDVGADLPLAATLRYRGAADGADGGATLATLALRYACAAEAEAEEPDPAVIEAAGHFHAARARREALEHVYAGRHDAARTVLASAVDALAAPAMAPAAPALAADLADLESLAERAPSGFDSRTRKEALYRSQVVRRSRRDYGAGH
ncbi:MAG TPA: VWA domain-containing protein [Thermomicrobiales bacterium]|nr:VWA domain-containing protein [Thermomicrobiales bacterium]